MDFPNSLKSKLARKRTRSSRTSSGLYVAPKVQSDVLSERIARGVGSQPNRDDNPFAAGTPQTRQLWHQSATTGGSSALSDDPLAFVPWPLTPPPSYSPIDDRFAFLSTFDTIYLVDDSGTMAGRSWRETAEAIRSIAPICTKHDADGIDIHFLNHEKAAAVCEKMRELTESRNDLPMKRQHRMCLPMTFEASNGNRTVLTSHDSGTEANHMDLELANSLGLPVTSEAKDKQQFKLAHGKIVESIGRTVVNCRFTADSEGQSNLRCYFNVFKKLAVPVLMGMKFLQATETLSTHRHRLVERPLDTLQSLRVCALGASTNQLVCVVDGKEVRATADTGSEIPLMSTAYASRRGIWKQSGVEKIMFADGSVGYTSGVADVTISLGRGFGKISKAIDATFHVLEGLTCDVLLDENLVEELEVFTQWTNAFITGLYSFLPSLCPIIHLGNIERRIFNVQESLLRTPKRVTRWVGSLFERSKPSSIVSEVSKTDTKSLFLDQLNQADQRENARQEAAGRRIAKLSEAERPSALAAEVQQQQRYTADRARLINDRQNVVNANGTTTTTGPVQP